MAERQRGGVDGDRIVHRGGDVDPARALEGDRLTGQRLAGGDELCLELGAGPVGVFLGEQCRRPGNVPSSAVTCPVNTFSHSVRPPNWMPLLLHPLTELAADALADGTSASAAAANAAAAAVQAVTSLPLATLPLATVMLVLQCMALSRAVNRLLLSRTAASTAGRAV
jgi:hypothetical protein